MFRWCPMAERIFYGFRIVSWATDALDKDHEARLVVQLEAPARLAGLQDTGTGRERALSNTGGTSCLIAEAAQKSGHFSATDECP